MKYYNDEEADTDNDNDDDEAVTQLHQTGGWRR